MQCLKNPILFAVVVVSHISIAYGLWFREVVWIVGGLVVLIAGKILYAKDCECKCHEEDKPRYRSYKKRRK